MLTSKKSNFFETKENEKAKKRGLEKARTLRFWYRQQYKLPENDPRYLDLTDTDILEEYWAHRCWNVIQKERRIPTEDDFDNDWLNGQIAKWELEDGDELRSEEHTSELQSHHD